MILQFNIIGTLTFKICMSSHYHIPAVVMTCIVRLHATSNAPKSPSKPWLLTMKNYFHKIIEKWYKIYFSWFVCHKILSNSKFDHFLQGLTDTGIRQRIQVSVKMSKIVSVSVLKFFCIHIRICTELFFVSISVINSKFICNLLLNNNYTDGNVFSYLKRVGLLFK